jgi:hypothetical protein
MTSDRRQGDLFAPRAPAPGPKKPPLGPGGARPPARPVILDGGIASRPLNWRNSRRRWRRK